MKEFFIWLFTMLLVLIGETLMIIYAYSRSSFDWILLLISIMLIAYPAFKWWEKYLIDLFNKKD